ncbi:hypothetical protein [Pseudomonas alkylphenolica]|uniref:hypothetical protein n=1 Tax=Pseudomonas alkylphenolica TaxID=237609 RepID=UPI0018DA2B0E|nr:hypothetical protein [Pseudomonas alkylphenolica]MBH3430814.1 hypothetical protein [Pseudomonas alkylphenolica]
MGESQQQVTKPELYERLIDRLGLALEVARTSVRLRDEVPAELELRGLSRAEFDVIKAYLDSLPEGRHGCAGAQLSPEPTPSASVVWLKDQKRSSTRAKSRTLRFK